VRLCRLPEWCGLIWRQNSHKGDGRYWGNSGQRWILARDGLSANDSQLNCSTQHFIFEGKDRL
jgi:hypothetical protein